MEIQSPDEREQETNAPSRVSSIMRCLGLATWSLRTAVTGRARPTTGPGTTDACEPNVGAV